MGKKRISQLGVGTSEKTIDRKSEAKPRGTGAAIGNTRQKPAGSSKVPKKRSREYLAKKSLLKPGATYAIDVALDLIKKMSATNFDETVEAHFNLKGEAKKQKRSAKIVANLPHYQEKLEIKTEPKAPIIHTIIGKASSSKPELKENLQAIMESLKKFPILSAYLKTTMGPSVRLNLDEDNRREKRDLTKR